MFAPIRFTSRQISGWTSGSTGSANGGMNIRGPSEPIWCSSTKTCGFHSW